MEGVCPFVCIFHSQLIDFDLYHTVYVILPHGCFLFSLGPGAQISIKIWKLVHFCLYSIQTIVNSLYSIQTIVNSDSIVNLKLKSCENNEKRS